MEKAHAWIGCITLALASLGLGGCSAIAGEQDANVNFKVKESSRGTFIWNNTLTVDLGPTSVSDALLTGVTLTTVSPAGTADLTYMSTLLGTGVGPDGQIQPFCTVGSFPAGEASVDATVIFTGNIIPFFDSTETLHLTWTGVVNTAYPSFPPDGFQVSAMLHVDPQ